jgi:hypothetical protein
MDKQYCRNLEYSKEEYRYSMNKSSNSIPSLCKGHNRKMNSDNSENNTTTNNKNKLKHESDRLLLDEADELSRNRKWTRDFALYIMFCRAMAAGDKTKAEACMKLLEPEVMNPLLDPVFK